MHNYNHVKQILSQATIEQLVNLYEKGQLLSVIEQAQFLRKNIQMHLLSGIYWRIISQNGNADKAIEAYKKSILLKPNFAIAHNNLGSALKLKENLTRL